MSAEMYNDFNQTSEHLFLVQLVSACVIIFAVVFGVCGQDIVLILSMCITQHTIVIIADDGKCGAHVASMEG